MWLSRYLGSNKFKTMQRRKMTKDLETCTFIFYEPNKDNHQTKDLFSTSKFEIYLFQKSVCLNVARMS